MKNQLEQLNKAYVKRLNKTTGLEHFVEYLRYLRDSTVIKTAGGMKALDNDPRITSLIIAMSEFEAYQNNKEEKQRKFHWDNFWEFVKINMEEWLVLNDSV